ncbi:MAG TPA: hypothetical protein VGI80_02135, partial [Pyrinomonadaceae bacterium]
ERSLREEFENYLKGVAVQLKQETVEFQQRIAAEFDRQRQAIDESFAEFTARFDSQNTFDEAFTATVAEHLRLARDEGAKITANAFAEAEKLEQETAQPEQPQIASYDAIRDAVKDISSKDSQSAILKALVNHASSFAPRGAFFIIKSEHLAGWKVFGDAAPHADDAVREVHFPVTDDSILSAAVNSVETVEGSAGERHGDSAFLDPLGFGHPDRMYAVPLVARGRAVAVLYADHTNDGTHVSREALETLVRVAGLTVELIAAAPSVAPAQGETSHDLHPTVEREATVQEYHTAPEPVSNFEQPAQDFSFSESVSYEGGFPQPESESSGYGDAPAEFQPQHEGEPSYGNGDVPFESAEPAGLQEVHDGSPFEKPAEELASEFEAEPRFDATPSFEPTHEFEPAPAAPFAAFEPASSGPAVEKSVVPIPGSRLSDRPVDLPIEVPEEERRSHNDARRFARLLVSEIKLYNEKKVLEGREHRDLYDRLREAIDRSREMYDKRVQPPVAARFDYFHYELVNSLAEGEPGRLGSGYPGPTVS